jgi:undecaprenol kinase/diacylglycerol kinase (ATP)
MKKFKNKNIFIAIKNSLSGLKYVFINHQHFRIELIFAFLVIILSYIFDLSIYEFLFIILAIFFVLFSEIINTLVEEILDIIEPNYNEKIKILKDISSGAVFITVLFSLILGIIIFTSKFKVF